MKIAHTIKRNDPSATLGDSITITTTYSSFDKKEIDWIEKRFPEWLSISDEFELNNAEERLSDDE